MLKNSAVLLGASAPEILRRAEYELLDAMPREVRNALQEMESDLSTFIAADMLNARASVPEVVSRIEILNREWLARAKATPKRTPCRTPL